MNCPFYGAAIIGSPTQSRPVLFQTHNNACALITIGQSPCRMQTEGKRVEWQLCPRNPGNNGSYTGWHFANCGHCGAKFTTIEEAAAHECRQGEEPEIERARR